MSVTSWIRRQFKDGVSVTDTIPGGCTSGATAITLADGSTFPDGSVGPFIVTIDQGLSTEEHVLIASRSGAVLTVATSGRGYGNGPPASAHGPGASVLHTINYQDLDEANQTMFQTLGQIAAKGDLLVGSAANTLTKLAIGAGSQTLQVASGTLSYVGFGSGRSQNVGSSNSDGTDTTYARSDHAHAGVTSLNTRQGAVTTQASDVETLFTADGQIFSGTGSGTGELIDLLAALKEYFTADNQVLAGTGTGTGELIGLLALMEEQFTATNQVLVGTGTATGALQTFCDTTTADIVPIGHASAAAGSKGQAADAAHVHPFTLFDRGSAITGAPPTASAGGFLIQASTENIVCNSSGQLNVTFPSAFPNGVLTVMLTPNQADNVGMGAINGTPTKTGFSANFNVPGGGSPGAVNIVFSWFAVGF